MKIKRPYPRRSAGRYPAGTIATLRDGRSFKVVAFEVTKTINDAFGWDEVQVTKHKWEEVAA